MSPAATRSEASTPASLAQPVDLKLEVLNVPVADLDRAKSFYGSLGWRLDADIAGEEFRVLQFTPPGSPTSVIFGKGITAAPYLVVSDIEAARADLAARGVDISEVYHYAGSEGRCSGPDPERRSYASWASFSDPDGNAWLLQEVTKCLPGRVVEETFPRVRTLRPHCGVPRRPMVSTRSVTRANTTTTGQTGTPSTWLRNMPGSLCRCERG
jgi:catechol 2,3-dioxygenase-like lactoylglutathione lyase family enzyme